MCKTHDLCTYYVLSKVSVARELDKLLDGQKNPLFT